MLEVLPKVFSGKLQNFPLMLFCFEFPLLLKRRGILVLSLYGHAIFLAEQGSLK